MAKKGPAYMHNKFVNVLGQRHKSDISNKFKLIYKLRGRTFTCNNIDNQLIVRLVKLV